MLDTVHEEINGIIFHCSGLYWDGYSVIQNYTKLLIAWKFQKNSGFCRLFSQVDLSSSDALQWKRK